MSKQFDVIVIGSVVPAGYIAAIRAAQLGFNTACIDEWKNAKGGPALGGTCTNVGCIPSKALLQSSEHYEQAGHTFADHGINVSGLSLDIGKMMARKDQRREAEQRRHHCICSSKNKITSFHGRGCVRRRPIDGRLRDSRSAGDKPAKTTDQRQAHHHRDRLQRRVRCPVHGRSTKSLHPVERRGACASERFRRQLGLIGSGVIGLEMGSVWRRLGAEVTVLEGAARRSSARSMNRSPRKRKKAVRPSRV